MSPANVPAVAVFNCTVNVSLLADGNRPTQRLGERVAGGQARRRPARGGRSRITTVKVCVSAEPF